VVLADGLEDLAVEVRRLLEDREAVVHVLLRDVELLVGEPSLLLEQLLGQPDLADVEEQPDLREHLELLLGKSQVAAEGREIDGDLQAVPVGGRVLLAQARDPHERIGVAHDALDHVLHDFLDALDLEFLADLDVVHELVEEPRGFRDRRARVRHFLLDAHLVAIGLRRDSGREQLRARLELLLGFARRLELGRSDCRSVPRAAAAEQAHEAAEETAAFLFGARRRHAVVRDHARRGDRVLELHARAARRAGAYRNDFLGHGGARGRRVGRLHLLYGAVERRAAGRGDVDRRRRHELLPGGTRTIDDHELAELAKRRDLPLILDQETLDGERSVPPGPIEIGDEHAQLELGSGNLCSHGLGGSDAIL
jgi:hypothetical protein